MVKSTNNLIAKMTNYSVQEIMHQINKATFVVDILNKNLYAIFKSEAVINCTRIL